jgi:DNA polymerase (family 10)
MPRKGTTIVGTRRETIPVTGGWEEQNRWIAERLEAFAVLLDLSGANPYSARAYRRAAELVRSTKAPVFDLVREGRIRELRGIGSSIEARLVELAETGDIAELRELEEAIDPALVGFGRLLGLNPTRMMEVARTLDVRTVDGLREAVAAGRLRSAPGIGPKTEQKVLAALEDASRPAVPRRARFLLNRGLELLEGIAGELGGTVAGDVRRMRDAPEHLAMVCVAEDPRPVVAGFERLSEIVALVDQRDRQAIGVTVDGIPVDLVVAEPARFGTELVRATGSPEYVEALEPLPDAPDEEGVYGTLGIPYCPPELREAPFRGEPPPLLDLEDIRGDLHCHTTWSDGRQSVEEMGAAARDLGYDYLAICDHTTSVSVVPGLDADDVRRQAHEIAAANELLAPFRVLRGIECDILSDGSLDLPDSVLAELDWVMASVHAGQRMPRAEMTKRVEEALRNPYVRALSHPTGRLIERRPPNALDLERVLEIAKETGAALEVNGLPDRLDLRDEHVRLAVEAGVPIVVSTDAHSTGGLGNIRLAVGTARRGWATAADVLNTRPLSAVLRT